MPTEQYQVNSIPSSAPGQILLNVSTISATTPVDQITLIDNSRGYYHYDSGEGVDLPRQKVARIYLSGSAFAAVAAKSAPFTVEYYATGGSTVENVSDFNSF